MRSLRELFADLLYLMKYYFYFCSFSFKRDGSLVWRSQVYAQSKQRTSVDGCFIKHEREHGAVRDKGYMRELACTGLLVLIP